MYIDVRDNNTEKLKRIFFNNNEYIARDEYCIGIYDDDSGDQYTILINDIPNLIKALEIAYKEWHTDEN